MDPVMNVSTTHGIIPIIRTTYILTPIFKRTQLMGTMERSTDPDKTFGHFILPLA